MLANIDTVFGRLLWLDISVATLNILLILAAKPILTRLYPEAPQHSGRFRFGLHLLRGVNLIIVLNLLYLNLWPTNEVERSLLGKMMNLCFVVYLALFSGYLSSLWILHRYGKKVDRQGVVTYIDSYTSRLLSLVSHCFITLIAIMAAIQIAGFTDLLQAGGVLGVLGVMLALTQAAWAPDLIAGVLILHSDMLVEGDVIELQEGGKNQLLKVYKTRLFYTEFLNLADNHRLMLSNAKLRDCALHNLSKFASAKGLRECLTFKIGYDVSPKCVQRLFETAFECAQKQAKQLPIEWQHGIEVQLNDTGDHAIEWAVFYHTKKVEQRLATRQRLLSYIHTESIERGISLSTPLTHVVASTQNDQ